MYTKNAFFFFRSGLGRKMVFRLLTFLMDESERCLKWVLSRGVMQFITVSGRASRSGDSKSYNYTKGKVGEKIFLETDTFLHKLKYIITQDV